MGLKTNSYVSKSTGVVLPEAYAMLKNLIIESSDTTRAIFAIQANRENAKNYKPLDTCEITFKWDRKTDPAEMAYTLAKGYTTVIEKINEETGEITEVTVFGELYGWQDAKV